MLRKINVYVISSDQVFHFSSIWIWVSYLIYSFWSHRYCIHFLDVLNVCICGRHFAVCLPLQSFLVSSFMSLELFFALRYATGIGILQIIGYHGNTFYPVSYILLNASVLEVTGSCFDAFVGKKLLLKFSKVESPAFNSFFIF